MVRHGKKTRHEALVFEWAYVLDCVSPVNLCPWTETFVSASQFSFFFCPSLGKTARLEEALDGYV